jgi:molybdopterin synthase catalytic subunit
MLRTFITSDPLDVAALLAEVGTPEDGAILVFAGTVRQHNEGRAVAGLRYDAYAAMAEAVLRQIAEETAARWDVSRLAAAHRTGDLAIGEASVVIAVSSPHRAEAFEAGRYMIEEIKQRLPVWKQERYAEGAERWLQGSTPRTGESNVE